MTDNQPMTAADVGKKLRTILDYVRDCQARVARDELIDLEGLDENIVAVCDAVASLPDHEGTRFEDDMQTLIDSLEVLMREMQEKQAALGGAE